MRKADAEDMALVKAYLELPVLLDVLELNIKKMKEADFKLLHIFELQLKSIQDEIIKQQRSVRQRMKQKGIKIIDEKRTPHSLDCEFLCRGYVDSISMLWGKVKADAEIMLADHLGVDINRIDRD
ncbi:hypothetical protein BK126_28270 [Paenibacillus sp. FSL H7-0326]|uniref:hypothetical protein n=1 Tax=Paenibacillus sp. FSL H7-0326 TaxID=1921144 RepID=UPI0009700584|nr:hypothetical protein [Paenibacillus sp. FSL H7-0326]OMC62763.1 hypothetical protein BK126_28270 [Paenibacillus sp. FSL H7-0326]